MALVIKMSINASHQAAAVVVVRGEAHSKLPHHFWYDYRAKDDEKHSYVGRVLHNYNNGVFALTQKVTKAIIIQQKEERLNNA